MRFSNFAIVLAFLSGWARAEDFADIKRCGNGAVSYDAERKTQDLIKLYGPVKAAASTKKVIPVFWHSIESSDGQGSVNSTIMHEQIRVLNKDYAEAGFHFKLVGWDTTVQDTWFFNLTNYETDDMIAMKAKLRQGGGGTLNLFTTQLSGNVLGCSTMPAWYSDSPSNDGVVLNHRTLPGGPYGDKYSLGRTATHEVGHWLGLYHTFEGNSCDETGGDYVSDTPPQKYATQGCPAHKNTCPGSGPDLIHNYMDYSWDSCVTGFTKGQIERMHTLTSLYRGI